MIEIKTDLFAYADGSGHEITVTMDDKSIKIQQFDDQYIDISMGQWNQIVNTIHIMADSLIKLRANK